MSKKFKKIRSVMINDEEYCVIKAYDNFRLVHIDKSKLRKNFITRGVGYVVALPAIALFCFGMNFGAGSTDIDTVLIGMGEGFTGALLGSISVFSVFTRWQYGDVSSFTAVDEKIDNLTKNFKDLLESHPDYAVHYIESMTNDELATFVKNSILLSSNSKDIESLDKIINNDSVSEKVKETARQKKNVYDEITVKVSKIEEDRIRKVKSYMEDLSSEAILESLPNPRPVQMITQ